MSYADVRRLTRGEYQELIELAIDLDNEIDPIPMELMSADEQRAAARGMHSALDF